MRAGEIKKRILAEHPNLDLEIKKDLAFQVAKHIEEARLVKGYTQKGLAERVGTHQSNIARAENGASLPSLSFLKRLADAFETYLIAPKFAFMEEARGVMPVWTAPTRQSVTEINEVHHQGQGFLSNTYVTLAFVSSRTDNQIDENRSAVLI